MSEENSVDPSPEQATAPSLEEQISQFAADLPDPASQGQVEPQTTQPATTETSADVASQLQQLSAELNQFRQERAQAEVTADINRAVDLVAQESGIENKDYVQFKLNKLAESDENFGKIWDNRHAKPEVLESALKAAAQSMKNDLDFKADPQLVENHRAAQESTKTSQSTVESEYSNELGERLGQAQNPAEFDRIWRSIMNGG